MMSTIRTAAPKALIARRFISNSARTQAAAVSIGRNNAATVSSHNASASRTVKLAAYAVLGSTAVVAAASHLLRHEVVYWTPNVRK
ncbi:hypothetical protein BGZ54_005197 [Gamsiella multidivaricata]|nr:hypothetical protein BGZ54_005197 [Gamsiella multidivaricata]